MKKNKRLIILLSILVVLIIIAVIINVSLKQTNFNYNYIKDKDWVLEDETETISLEGTDKFTYYDHNTNNIKEGYETCTTFELVDKVIKLNCDKEIKIITAGETKLYLKIGEENKKFKIKSSGNYKIFNIGYLDNINAPVVVTTYEDFINYLDSFKTTYYDSNGQPENSSTDAIRAQYNQVYFDDNNLAIYYAPTNSGSIRIKNVQTKINGSTVEIKYDYIKPEVGTMDMNGFIITVEVNKNITKAK